MLNEQVPSFGSRIILYSFYFLFFLTPLIWSPFNFELFEYNKMIFVYLLTTVITGVWLLKIISSRSLILNQTPLDIPILLFLLANILSTIFSIDTHTSIWGYYSRSNGGLLSIVCYTLLFFAFSSNINKEQALKVLKMGLWGGLLVALWAIPEHFGISPSCVILRDTLTADCWVQDVQARVFATLGQPNWLAAYLGMLIFPALYFLLTATTTKKLIIYYLLLIAYYLSFTFTYSRSGMLGFLAGLAVFIFLLVIPAKAGIQKSYRSLVKPGMTVLGIFLLINLIFGSALTRFNLSQLIHRTTDTPENRPTGTLTQLENGGTESGQIRLIVWQGALDIFKHNPILGSGVETFAYSYYQYRPKQHNLVSEWDFLYNKAHNEYLNYLANTGILGFGTYMLTIIAFIFWTLKRIFKQKNGTNLLLIGILSSFITNLIVNFTGFSVVITNLFFFLFPAIAFVTREPVKPYVFPKKLLNLNLSLFTNFIYRRSFYTKIAKTLIIFFILYLIFSIFKIWLADTIFSQGEKASEVGNAGKAYNYLSDAASLNKNEPFYLSELGFAAASAALALKDTDATLSATLKNRAVAETDQVLKKSPKNVSYYRTAVRTYYQLADIDPSYIQKTLEMIDKTIALAPTDPKLYYNKAVILGQNQKPEEAIEVLKKTIELKPNYKEAYFALSLFYFDEDRPLEAVETMQKVLQLEPTNPGALEQLIEWGKQGIATNSAKP